MKFWTATSTFSCQQLKDLFGLNENLNDEDLKEGSKWKTNIIVKTKGEIPTDHSTNSFNYYLKALYAGSDLSEIDKEKVDDEEVKADTEDFRQNIEDAYNMLNSEMAKRFAKNPYGFALTYLYEGFRYLFGDSVLALAHTITFSNTKFVYSYDQLDTEEYEDINKYTNVGKYKNGNNSEGQKEITIKNENAYEDEEYRRFSSTTKIPVITIDLYNIAADNVEFFDINFFNIDENRHPPDKSTPWVYLRNFATNVIHVTIYIAAALLLIILIVNGIQIVGHSFDNPEARAEHIKILRRVAISLLMLVGSVVIMTLCTYGSNTFLNIVKVEDKEELPIRVNVEEAGYSFSTNITGYFRYMSEIEGIHNYREKGMYTFLYILLAWVNLALAIFMDFRVIVLMILAMIGPILAALYSLNIQGAMRYRNWIKSYVCLAFVQIIFAIVYRIIFQFAI